MLMLMVEEVVVVVVLLLLLLLRLLLRVLVSEGLLWLRGAVQSPGEVLVAGAVGRVRLDGGSHLVVSLRLRSGNSVDELKSSLADLCIRHGGAGVEGLQLLQLGLTLRMVVRGPVSKGGGGGGGV